MILVCGEALVDLFVDGPARASEIPARASEIPARASETSARTGELAARAIAGGSPFNVAVGLARLGVAAGYFGAISTDAFGTFLLGRLHAEAVGTAWVKRSPAPTPLAVVAAGPDGQPAYTFHAAGTAFSDVLPADLPPPGVEAIAFGSFALSSEPVGSALLALAEREGGRAVVSLDPNLRPALAGELGAWRARFARFASKATIIKLSTEDLRAAWGPEADPADWLAQGVKLVVLTDGAAGATAYHANGQVHVPARAVQVVDTVGAGDTFHAALLAWLSHAGRLSIAGVAALGPAELHGALHYAALAASVTCSRRGADLPRRAELLAAAA